MKYDKNLLLNHFLVFLATFLIAGSFIASKELTRISDPLSLTFLRFMMASIIVLPFAIMQKNSIQNIIKTMPRALVIGFFYALFFVSFFEALKYTSSLNTGALFTLTPFITAILSIFIFKNKISTKYLLAYIFGIIGTCWVIFEGNIKLLQSFTIGKGELIFIISILAMSCYSISMKLLYKKDQMIILVSSILISGSIWMLVAMIFTKQTLELQSLQGSSLFYMLYLVIGATLLTVYLYQRTTIELGPRKVISYSYLIPSLVAIISLLFYGKNIQAEIIPGILISAIATIIIQRN